MVRVSNYCQGKVSAFISELCPATMMSLSNGMLAHMLGVALLSLNGSNKKEEDYEASELPVSEWLLINKNLFRRADPVTLATHHSDLIGDFGQYLPSHFGIGPLHRTFPLSS